MFLPCAGTVIITLYFLISFRGGGVSFRSFALKSLSFQLLSVSLFIV